MAAFNSSSRGSGALLEQLLRGCDGGRADLRQGSRLLKVRLGPLDFGPLEGLSLPQSGLDQFELRLAAADVGLLPRSVQTGQHLAFLDVLALAHEQFGHPSWNAAGHQDALKGRQTAFELQGRAGCFGGVLSGCPLPGKQSRTEKTVALIARPPIGRLPANFLRDHCTRKASGAGGQRVVGPSRKERGTASFFLFVEPY